MFGTNEGSEFVSGYYDQRWRDGEKGPLHSINGNENEEFGVLCDLTEQRDYIMLHTPLIFRMFLNAV